MCKITGQNVTGNGKGCFGNSGTELLVPWGSPSLSPKLDRVSQNISSLMCWVLRGAELPLMGRVRKNPRSKDNSWKPRQGTAVLYPSSWAPVLLPWFRLGFGIQLLHECREMSLWKVAAPGMQDRLRSR